MARSIKAGVVLHAGIRSRAARPGGRALAKACTDVQAERAHRDMEDALEVVMDAVLEALPRDPLLFVVEALEHLAARGAA